MNTFVNAFRCCKRTNNDEFILELIQYNPVFNPQTGAVDETAAEVAGSFVMPLGVAKALAEHILKAEVSESEGVKP